MKLQLCSYKLSKLAKEKGFNWSCRYSYQKNKNTIFSSVDYNGEELFTQQDIEYAEENSKIEHYLAPTLELLSKWLRDVHRSEVYVHPYFKSIINNEKLYEVVVDKAVTTWTGYKTYEKALEVGLFQALKLI